MTLSNSVGREEWSFRIGPCVSLLYTDGMDLLFFMHLLISLFRYLIHFKGTPLQLMNNEFAVFYLGRHRDSPQPFVVFLKSIRSHEFWLKKASHTYIETYIHQWAEKHTTATPCYISCLDPIKQEKRVGVCCDGLTDIEPFPHWRERCPHPIVLLALAWIPDKLIWFKIS